MLLLDLTLSPQYIKGVGPARASMLSKLGIETIEDLLFFIPRDYLDLSPLNFKQASEDKKGAFPCIVTGAIEGRKAKSGIWITKIPITDGQNNGYAVFFNQPYLARIFHKDDRLLLIGKMNKKFGAFEITNPEWIKFDKNTIYDFERICPIYPLTKGLSQKIMRNIVRQTLQYTYKVEETLPKQILKDYDLMPIQDAIKNVHFPKSFERLKQARKRIAFEELLLFQLAMLTTKRYFFNEKRINLYKNLVLKPFLSGIPFSLTDGQLKVICQIKRDLSSKHNMNRLVQGDVGSGKTVVACAALYLAVINGLQGAMMAPTEILADQHYETITSYLKPHSIKVDILKGSTSEKERQRIFKDLKEGKTQILVGTHAIIQENVEFHKLGMVITDEQHRFGVKQREKLVKKGQYPDTLVMSATPIPRTIALVLYSDLDISTIDTMPKGRQKVQTYVVDKAMRRRIYNFMAEEVKKGHLVYVVCPCVEENELNMVNVQDHTKMLKKSYPEIKIEALHGKMKAEEKDKKISDFISKKVQVLVTTTVIEVGVDVPEATLIIVENAERFGLAQLHQLRGRVGRSNIRSYCILISDSKDKNARSRLTYLMKCHNGFEIAQKDLEIRGPGEFLGVKQHGFFGFKMAELTRDTKWLEITRNISKEIIERGCLDKPEFGNLKKKLYRKYDLPDC